MLAFANKVGINRTKMCFQLMLESVNSLVKSFVPLPERQNWKIFYQILICGKTLEQLPSVSWTCVTDSYAETGPPNDTVFCEDRP